MKCTRCGGKMTKHIAYPHGSLDKPRYNMVCFNDRCELIGEIRKIKRWAKENTIYHLKPGKEPYIVREELINYLKKLEKKAGKGAR